MEIFIADRQGITCAGLMYIIDRMSDCSYKYVEDKASLLCQLPQDEPCVVIIDFTLFDFNDISELMIVAQRFRQAHWLLFSEDLSIDFARQIAADSYSFSIVMKESPLSEIREALHYAPEGRRFICQRMAEMLEQDIPVILAVGPSFPRFWRKTGACFCRPAAEGAYIPAVSARAHFVTDTGMDDEWVELSSWGCRYYLSRKEYERYTKECSNSLLCSILSIKHKKADG